MPKTITLRVPDSVHRIFKRSARGDNRTLANMVETAALRHIEECSAAGEAGLARILANKALLGRLRRAARAGGPTRRGNVKALGGARLVKLARGLKRRGAY